LCFSDYFIHLWNYNKNKYHVYCVFHIILDTWIDNVNKNHVYCVFRIIVDTYGIIMKIKIIYIVCFGLFYTLMELLCEIKIIYIVFFGLF